MSMDFDKKLHSLKLYKLNPDDPCQYNPYTFTLNNRMNWNANNLSSITYGAPVLSF